MALLLRPVVSISSTTVSAAIAGGGRRCACANASSASTTAKLFSSVVPFSNPAWRRHISCHRNRTAVNNGGYRKRRAFSTNSSSSTNNNSSSSNIGNAQVQGKQPSKSSKPTITDNNDTTPISIEQQLSTLQSEIAHLSYLIKQTSTQQLETASLSRRAEARSYIIEHKLMDVQSHVVKIPEMQQVTKSLRQYLEKYSPSLISDAFLQPSSKFATSTSSGKEVLINKYTIWATLASLFLFYRYRVTMYQRTSEEVADIAAMTLQQDTLRCQIQETLQTVANSPSTLASLSSLFQQLISEERTQQHLIDLIVRALGSEGVRKAAVELLDGCFQNEKLQGRAGEFLKVAAKGAVLPWWVVKSLEKGGGAAGGGAAGRGRKEEEDGSGGSGDDNGKISEDNGGDEVVINNGREDE
eukprot:scaffold26646_cov155-Skeletonema_menzelii.AAC.2